MEAGVEPDVFSPKLCVAMPDWALVRLPWRILGSARSVFPGDPRAWASPDAFHSLGCAAEEMVCLEGLVDRREINLHIRYWNKESIGIEKKGAVFLYFGRGLFVCFPSEQTKLAT